ncbi:OsmC family protein [Oricola sp.]|uniref:OsmC family protein n=1 Tax=Oricola sp. TaxID=1979950 RepID=UPI0025F55A20|nr:OsmC family protein [Oricola sp.]MCI5075899.1 OsmC family protein [Oricola sp.]
MNAPVKPAKVAINGVDVPTLLGTIGAVSEHRDLAKFTFRANGEWLNGTHTATRINGYFGAGAEQGRGNDFVVEADHPAVLCGGDNAPTPPELLLAALSACITAGIGNIASARQIKLDSVETSLEADANLLGMLGLDDSVRNGFGAIRMNVKIQGDASADKLRQVVDQSVSRSAVFDMLTNGLPVTVGVDAG